MARSSRAPEMRSRYRLDPEIAAVLEPMAAKAAEAPPIERGNWKVLRERANTSLAFLGTLNPPVSADVPPTLVLLPISQGGPTFSRRP